MRGAAVMRLGAPGHEVRRHRENPGCGDGARAGPAATAKDMGATRLGMVKVWALAVCMLLLLAGCAQQNVPVDPVPDPVVDPEPEVPAQNFTPDPPALPWFPNDGTAVLEDVAIPSFDGHVIPLTIHKPAIANATTQVPVLIHSHGFGGKHTSADVFTQYIAAGFAVVSFTQRGHGDAMDEPVGFMQPDLEVLDMVAVIDMIAGLDWVLMENETTRDPVLGGIGHSYAGAMQLMGAIFDHRIDAIVPEITWSDIAQALAPNGGPKSSWIDLFYLSGTVLGTVAFNDDFHAGFAWLTATNELPAGQAPGVPDLVSEFQEASPATYPHGLTVPTLLIQGMTDTLFPLNHAVANYDQIRAMGAPVALYTHLGGHIVHSEAIAPGASPVPFGLQTAPGGTPCGTVAELGIAWHQTHLLGLDSWKGAEVCIAFEDETHMTSDTFPLNGTIVKEMELGGPFAVPQAPVGISVPIRLDIDGTIVGIPRLSGTITAGADAIIYATLRIPERGDPLEQIVDDQAMPYRVKGPVVDGAFAFDLAGVAVALDGRVLELHISMWEPQYFGNAERVPGAVALDDLVLQMPVVA